MIKKPEMIEGAEAFGDSATRREPSSRCLTQCLRNRWRRTAPKPLRISLDVDLSTPFAKFDDRLDWVGVEGVKGGVEESISDRIER